jgi:pimeloyl-ACP methyl ester carboxylesterase
MAITNLYTYYKYSGRALPALIVMHGWDGDATSFNETTDFGRWAGYGYFVIVPGMRGRNSASGSRDASGREIYDIYDALVECRRLFPHAISPDKAVLLGYSGGGGNVLAAACKFPDAWSMVISYFGMSDYGRDGTDGWYYNNGGSYTTAIATSVGGVPGDVPNNYYARDATAAIQNYSGGHLHLYHSSSDTTVPYVHSQRVAAAMLAAGLSNYTAHYSTDYTHGYPADIPALVTSEADWKGDGLSSAAWTVPASGTHTVIGYMVNKRYACWLRAYGSTTYGLDAAATVAYGAVANQYTVTPLTGAIDVTITQADGKTGSASYISTGTNVTVS